MLAENAFRAVTVGRHRCNVVARLCWTGALDGNGEAHDGIGAALDGIGARQFG